MACQYNCCVAYIGRMHARWRYINESIATFAAPRSTHASLPLGHANQHNTTVPTTIMITCTPDLRSMSQSQQRGARRHLRARRWTGSHVQRSYRAQASTRCWTCRCWSSPQCCRLQPALAPCNCDLTPIATRRTSQDVARQLCDSITGTRWTCGMPAHISLKTHNTSVLVPVRLTEQSKARSQRCAHAQRAGGSTWWQSAPVTTMLPLPSMVIPGQNMSWLVLSTRSCVTPPDAGSYVQVCVTEGPRPVKTSMPYADHARTCARGASLTAPVR